MKDSKANKLVFEGLALSRIRLAQGELKKTESLAEDPDVVIRGWHEFIDAEIDKFWKPARFCGPTVDVDFVIPSTQPTLGQVTFENLFPIVFAVGGDSFKKQIEDFIRKNYPADWITPEKRSKAIAKCKADIFQGWIEFERECRALETIGGYYDRPGDMPAYIFLARELDALSE